MKSHLALDALLAMIDGVRSERKNQQRKGVKSVVVKVVMSKSLMSNFCLSRSEEGDSSAKKEANLHDQFQKEAHVNSLGSKKIESKPTKMFVYGRVRKGAIVKESKWKG
jgi:hypothetical protein